MRKTLRKNWLTIFALATTVAGFIGTYWYLGQKSGVRSIPEFLGGLSAADFGQWLSGIAGTLAFLWLVIGYFQQGQELRAQKKELNRQANAIEQNQMLAKRDLFGRMLNQAIDELDSIAVKVLLSCNYTPFSRRRKSAIARRDSNYRYAYFDYVIDAFKDCFTSVEMNSPEGIVEKALIWGRILRASDCLNDIWRYLTIVDSIRDEAKRIAVTESLELQFLQGRAFALYELLTPLRLHKDKVLGEGV